MTELTGSLLAAAREGLAPDAAIAARVRAKVAAAVGVAATTGSVAAIIPAKASAVTLKLGAALLVVAGATTALVVAAPDRAPEAPRLSIPTSEADELRTDIRVVAPAERWSQHALERFVEGTPAPAPPPPPSNHAAVELAATPAPLGTPLGTPLATLHADSNESGASLSREVELIDLAMVSLRKRAPHAALEAIKAYDRVTLGRGQMAEDAAAIEIEARCHLDLDVTEKLDRFDRKWPESAQRERIQTTCFAIRP